MSLQQWSDQVCDALGIEITPDLKGVLDTARDVAHTVERPAAPVTAFLIGYAAARRGGSAQDVADVTSVVARLVEDWPDEEDRPDGPGSRA
ncbi:MAG: DUF6457 domain-containing protein [Nocardioidaceae bacterium]